ncbi:MAG: hypothetical protein AAFO95_03965 [Cyanobacteria bacterium J06600_6]
MNIYGAAVINTGLSIILINCYTLGAMSSTSSAIAAETLDNANINCHQIDSQSLAPSKTIPTDNITEQPYLIASAETPPDLTQSSFWWAALQFDPFGGKLVQNWLTYPQKQQINLIVNWRLWGLLDYFGRYRFVNQFGTVARKHGYSLNIFNQKDQCLASYRYNSTSIPPKWELNLEKLGRASLPIEPESIQQYPAPEGP